MSQPIVSIITPTYNSIQFINVTIQSIINQTYLDWELIITDDCSSDGTWEFLQELSNNNPKIKIFQLKKNSGPGVARNNSIKNATGRFIAFCDSDDQWKPNKLEKQLDFMFKNELVLSFSSYDVIDEEGNSIGEIKAPKKISYRKMLKNNYIGCLTAMYDTQKIGKVFMPEIRKRQDWALWLVIIKKTSIAMGIQQNLSIYRKRNNSVSSNKIKNLKYTWIIYRQTANFSVIKSALYFMLYLVFYFKKILVKD